MKIRSLVSQNVIWPSIDEELLEHKENARLRGEVLNAGCGNRDIQHLVDGNLTNQDLTWEGDTRTSVHIQGPIHCIPREDNFFDTILCIAVLEHVANPEEIIPEFYRVTKPGGFVIASVPFLQPEHKVPTDYQRYTIDGLRHLFEKSGFEVLEIKPLFTVYHTLHWIAFEWLHLRSSLMFRLLRWLVLPPLVFMARKSSLKSQKLASAHQIVALKPNVVTE